MGIRRVVIPLIVILVVVTVVTSYVVQSSKNQKPSIEPPIQSRPVEPDKEAAIKSRLAVLLADQGLNLREAAPNPNSAAYRMASVRWEITPTSAATESSPPDQRIGRTQVVALSTRRVGDLPRQRSLELSAEQLLVVGVGEDAAVLWWHSMTDPRLIRAESPGVNGEIKNETVYLPSVDFRIAYPDGTGIKTLRLYHPVWNGKDFTLELIGTVSVADESQNTQ